MIDQEAEFQIATRVIDLVFKMIAEFNDQIVVVNMYVHVLV